MYKFPKLAQRLGKVKHFRNLNAMDCIAIVSAGQVLRFSAGDVLFEEGHPCSGLFVLFKGRVNLCKRGLQGQECILNQIRPVIMFNEVAALDGGPNPVTGIAGQDCITWRIGHDAFRQLTTRYTELGISLLQVLAARSRLLISCYEDLLCRPIRARTAKVLLDLTVYGQLPVDRRLHSNLELAARVATSPEAFSRSLKDLRESGAVQCSRASIQVVAPEQLARMALVERDT